MNNPATNPPPPASSQATTAWLDQHPAPTTNLDHALAYARRGWRVIPVPPGRKYPEGFSAWQRDGSTDEDRIRHWWTQAPDHGIGILTGPGSGLWVLDVDVADGKHGDDTLADLCDAYSVLPDTHEVITGSGGRHIYFAWPDNGQDIRNNQSGTLGPGLDVRGEGGFVVAPPSIHANGQAYAHDAGTPDGHLAAAPGWLLAMLAPPESGPAPAQRVTSLAAGDRPGDLWAATTTWADLLGADGWTHHHTDRDGEEHWTRPGKERRDGTSATTGYKGSDVLKVFTSSHPQLRAEETYTKFGYLAATRFGGDHSAARQWCADQGHHAPSATLRPIQLASSTPGTAAGDQGGTEAAPASADGWPEVEPLDEAPDLPPFPIDSLPVWIRNHARSVADQNQVAIDMPASIALGVLSAVLNGHVRVQATEGWIDGVNLWILALARAGENKSPVVTAMIGPAREHEANLRRFAAASLAEHEQQIAALDKRAKDADEVFAKLDDPDKAAQALKYRAQIRELTKPGAGEIFASDATMEALVDLLANNNEHGTVADTEGTVLSIVAGRYSNASNVEFMLKSWSGDHHIVRRKTSGTVRMEEPRLAVLLTVQPERWIAVLTNAELRGTGFAERFMVTRVPTKVGRRRHDLGRQALDAAAAATYHDELLDFATRASRWGHPPTLRLDDDAADTYDRLRNDIEQRLAPDIGDLDGHATFTAKMTASVLRAAGILHLAWGHHPADPIDGDTMARAANLGHYWLAHQLGPLVDAQAITDAHEIIDWALRTNTNTATALEITRAIHRFRGDNDRRTRALTLLEERGLARSGNQWPLATARQGVSVVVNLHPHLHRAKQEDPREHITESDTVPNDGHEASQPRAPRADSLKEENKSLSLSEGGQEATHPPNPEHPREPREVAPPPIPAWPTDLIDTATDLEEPS